MKPYKFTTLNTTNLRKVANGLCALRGIAACNTQDTPIFVKFYWFKPAGSAEAPTVGTTVPDLTIAVPRADVDLGPSGDLLQAFEAGLVAGDGALFIAVTAAAGDTDTTAVAAGSIVTLFLDGP